MVLGIDVGGTTIKFGLYDNDNLIKKWAVETDDAEGVFRTINEQIELIAAEYGAPSHVGAAFPGPVREDGYCEICPNIPGIANMYPADKIDVPAIICNDANAAALAEYQIGAGKKYKSIVMITIGTGIGCGIVLGGKVLIGAHGIAAELGHTIDGETEVEKLCSAAAMAVKYGSKDAKTVIDDAKAGKPEAEKVLDDAMNALGRVLANLTVTLDPEAFVIGGGVCAAGDFVLDRIKKAYDKYLVTTKVRADIVIAELGNDAGIYGAAHC